MRQQRRTFEFCRQFRDFGIVWVERIKSLLKYVLQRRIVLLFALCQMRLENRSVVRIREYLA